MISAKVLRDPWQPQGVGASSLAEDCLFIVVKAEQALKTAALQILDVRGNTVVWGWQHTSSLRHHQSDVPCQRGRHRRELRDFLDRLE